MVYSCKERNAWWNRKYDEIVKIKKNSEIYTKNHRHIVFCVLLVTTCASLRQGLNDEGYSSFRKKWPLLPPCIFCIDHFDFEWHLLDMAVLKILQDFWKTRQCKNICWLFKFQVQDILVSILKSRNNITYI